MRSTRVLTTSVVGLAALLAACAEAPTSAPSVSPRVAELGSTASAAIVPSTNALQLEQFRVCKVGSSATFSYSVDYVSTSIADESGTFSLNSGECVTVAQAGGPGSNVSVTETSAPAGYVLDRVELQTGVSTSTACGGVSISNSTLAGPTVTGVTSGSSGGACRGAVATFYNVIPTGQIGNFVWVDSNNNGIQDSGEPGIPGVTMTLGGDASATATTDANGFYSFTGLAKGNYTVTVGAGPAGFTASPADQGLNDAIDSDGLAPVAVNLPTNSTTDLTYDFGFVPPPPAGCTLTIGYWKTHAGFTGNNADVVSQYLPIWLGTAGGVASTQVTTATQAVSILSMSGGASNGIVKLKAQLLAAKLNIASGASSAAVSATIATADAFLATNAASSWSSLPNQTKAQVNSWMTALDNYNNGLVGPGHCGTTGGI